MLRQPSCYLFLFFCSCRSDRVYALSIATAQHGGSCALVAASHGFVYAALAVAPLMVVVPILQLSLIFRIFLSQLLNRQYEVMNAAVIIGSIVAVIGSIGVSMNTDHLLDSLKISSSLADTLRIRIDSGN